MMDFLRRIFGMADEGPQREPRMKGDVAYDRAMDASADLLFRIREAGRESDVARTLITDIWTQAQNIPFMTTVYEAVQEAKAGPETMRDKRYIPILINGGGHRQR
jgi:hypothetical protein